MTKYGEQGTNVNGSVDEEPGEGKLSRPVLKTSQ